MEEWKPIKDFPEYEVSNLGRILSVKKKQVIRQDLNPDGYPTVSLYHLGVRKTKSVHRLVGLSFLPNPDNLTELDHINQEKDDNRAENLRWVTRSANCINRTCWNTTGLKNISQRKTGLYQVSITRNHNRVIKHFKKLEEAIAYRDSVLNQIISEP
jgi:hypothetical protein